MIFLHLLRKALNLEDQWRACAGNEFNRKLENVIKGETISYLESKCERIYFCSHFDNDDIPYIHVIMFLQLLREALNLEDN